MDYVAAAASGALAATGIGTVGAIVANSAISGTAYLANSAISGEKATAEGLLESVVVGGISGAIGGSGTSATKVNGIRNTAKSVLKTAVSPKKIAMYTGKIAATKAAVRMTVGRTAASIISSPWVRKGYKYIRNLIKG